MEIVVLSRNRNNILEKSINEWKSLPYRFFVYHNSKTSLGVSDTENIRYCFCPDLNFSQRSRLAIESLSGDFAMLLADDDRVVPSGVNSALSLLNRDIDLQSVGGKVVGSYKYGNRITGSFAYVNMHSYKNISEDIFQRIKTHFSTPGFTPQGSLYKIYRTESFKRVLRLIAEFEKITTPYIYELIGELTCVSLGNTTSIDEVYWIRNWENDLSQYPDWDRGSNLFDWWFSDTNYEHVQQFISTMNKEFSVDESFLRENLNYYIISRQNMDNNGNRQRRKLHKNFQLLKYLINRHTSLFTKVPADIHEVVAGPSMSISEENAQDIVRICRALFNE